MVFAAAGQEESRSASEADDELDVEALYKAKAEFIGRVIQRLAGPGPHVDDLLQETFIIAYRKRGVFDSTRSEPATWLYGIAAKLCSRHRRGLLRFGRLKATFGEAIEQQEPSELADQVLERSEEIVTVRAAIQKLPFKQREVFVLFELEGLDGQRIADLVGIPIGTVWTRLRTARETFSRLMKRKVEQR
jgi:RNA polymerase sigma-70 factor (ECF subfamily)